MIRVWRHDDATIPTVFANETYRGGDEDYVIVGPAEDEDMFERVARAMDSDFSRERCSRVEHEGGIFLVWTVCHA